MSAIIGNTNGRGAKGRSGRKSAYQENMDADALVTLWNEPHTKSELIKMIRGGKYSLKSIWLLKAMSGNERILNSIFLKLFPNNINIQSNVRQKSMAEVEAGVREILSGIKPKELSKKKII